MRYSSRRNRDPYILTARFASVCKETGKAIAKGEECLYYPNDKTVYCLDSKQASDFRSWQFDVNMLGCDY